MSCCVLRITKRFGKSMAYQWQDQFREESYMQHHCVRSSICPCLSLVLNLMLIDDHDDDEVVNILITTTMKWSTSIGTICPWMVVFINSFHVVLAARTSRRSSWCSEHPWKASSIFHVLPSTLSYFQTNSAHGWQALHLIRFCLSFWSLFLWYEHRYQL
jgi:hypothetical protein